MELLRSKFLTGTNLYVSELCLGGGPFGWTCEETEARKILDEFVSLGGNFIDTADMYAEGISEEIIGRWLHGFGRREQMFIATKVGDKSNRKGLSRENIIKSCDESLRRLGTDYIDIYFCHQDDISVSVIEILECMLELRQSGKIRFAGASNFSAERLLEAQAEGLRIDAMGFAVLQENYSLAYRSKYENGLKTFVERCGISNTPYFSLAKGFLSGNYRMDTPNEKYRAAHGGVGVLEYKNQIFVDLVYECERIAKRHSSSISSVALAWLRAQPTIIAPITSARTLWQLREIAMVVHLSEEELFALTSLSANL